LCKTVEIKLRLIKAKTASWKHRVEEKGLKGKKATGESSTDYRRQVSVPGRLEESEHTLGVKDLVGKNQAIDGKSPTRESGNVGAGESRTVGINLPKSGNQDILFTRVGASGNLTGKGYVLEESEVVRGKVSDGALTGPPDKNIFWNRGTCA